MGELTDIRHVQLARILGLPRDSSPLAVENAARAMPSRLADALFSEAADSDDVTGAASAVGYLEDRLAFFEQIVSTETADAVRRVFERHVAAWDE